MNGALFELVWRGWRGGLVRRLRRLRQPRYLIAFLFSAAYFGFLVLPKFFTWARQVGEGGPAGMAGDAGMAADAAQLTSLASSLALAAGVTVLWIFASAKPALQLSEADIELLLPAPLLRRQVIELSLWWQQAGLLFGALVLTLMRGHGSPADRLGRLLLAWSLLTLTSLHSKGVSLWKARLRELSPAVARRRVGIAIAAAAAYWSAIALALRGAMVPAAGPPGAGAAGAAPGPQGLVDVLHGLAVAPPPVVTILLAPFRWLATAIFGGAAGRPGGGISGAGGPRWPVVALSLGALVAAHYEWVVRSRARFEDAAVERARRQLERRSRRLALPARSRQREPFRLASVGLPEAAIYWKNLLIPGRVPLARRAVEVALPAVLAWAIGAAIGAPLAFVAAAAGAGLLLMVMVPPFAGLTLRHDLRSDLLHFEVVRPWPLPGWRLVAAELLAPATTALSWTLTGCGLVLGAALAAGARLAQDDLRRLVSQPERWYAAANSPAAGPGASLGTFAAVAAFCIALLIAGLAVILLSISVQNVAALLLPGWVALGPERRAASGLGGQRMLVVMGQFLTLALGLLPGALAVAAALLAGNALGISLAPWQAPPLALLGSLPVLAEVALLVRIGGACWDRLDPSEELLNPTE